MIPIYEYTRLTLLYKLLQSNVHSIQRSIQFSKKIYSVFGIAIKAVFDFYIIIFSRLQKRVPRSGFSSRFYRKKSQGAKSGELGDCMMIFVLLLAKNSRIMFALHDGALPWCKIYQLFSHKFIAETRLIHQNVLSLSITYV